MLRTSLFVEQIELWAPPVSERHWVPHEPLRVIASTDGFWLERIKLWTRHKYYLKCKEHVLLCWAFIMPRHSNDSKEQHFHIQPIPPVGISMFLWSLQSDDFRKLKNTNISLSFLRLHSFAICLLNSAVYSGWCISSFFDWQVPKCLLHPRTLAHLLLTLLNPGSASMTFLRHNVPSQRTSDRRQLRVSPFDTLTATNW